MQRTHGYYAKTAFLATLLAAVVVMLGAYTRLGDAGLGCPDWPGCFGHITVPQSQAALRDVSAHYGPVHVEPAKAWKEMVHRYVAGSLGLLIVGLAVVAFAKRSDMRNSQRILAVMLCVALVCQALLGMWTVTWLLLPLVVMGHLLGGMTIAALLWTLALVSARPKALHAVSSSFGLRSVVSLCTLVLAAQIFLGGWTTSNYASVVCPDFPFCRGQLWPAGMAWAKAFHFSSPIGTNYEGGVLQSMVRVTIQMAHRYGAVVVVCLQLPVALWMAWANRYRAERLLGILILLTLGLQVMLGVLNVVWLLPMGIAVAHNGVALLLLLLWVTALYAVFASPRASFVAAP